MSNNQKRVKLSNRTNLFVFKLMTRYKSKKGSRKNLLPYIKIQTKIIFSI